MSSLRYCTLVLFATHFVAMSTSKNLPQEDASPAADNSLKDAKTDRHQRILFEGDMALTFEQYHDVQSLIEENKEREDKVTEPEHHVRSRRKAARDLTIRWPKATIPYEFDSSFNKGNREVLLDAMRHWEKFTCIRFKPHSPGLVQELGNKNFVKFIKGKGCWSEVGMFVYGNEQMLSMDDGCLFNGGVGAAIHELGHTVGFFHEQSRPDRDSYVKVLWENVRKNQKHNFEKYDWDRVNDFNVPYDYISVMHYRSDEFATRVGRRKLRTVVTTDPFFQDLIGQRISLSFFDIKLANAMYGCSDHCSPTVTCKGEAFLSRDCKCMCRTHTSLGAEECPRSSYVQVSEPPRPRTLPPRPRPRTWNIPTRSGERKSKENAVIKPKKSKKASKCYPKNGASYRGKLSTTIHGESCLSWSDTLDRDVSVHTYPGGLAGIGKHNYCRNPPYPYSSRPWCYVKSSRYWDYCDIPLCRDRDGSGVSNEVNRKKHRKPGYLSRERGRKHRLWLRRRPSSKPADTEDRSH
ncbi:PREDICTED: blastula protease 10-like isoform X2 [Branchiostoma belcheri]|uniref:Metalloendopeptidase n=1 Tax=Branchiostoma belcheri TaxID=7741 RepID=A0A6P4XY41_BRABE|nr:PREDICTED: blastula protease 10-like isoform X2 [Branchiostoma belcheri]